MTAKYQLLINQAEPSKQLSLSEQQAVSPEDLQQTKQNLTLLCVTSKLQNEVLDFGCLPPAMKPARQITKLELAEMQAMAKILPPDTSQLDL